jgi:hypothetical protein
MGEISHKTWDVNIECDDIGCLVIPGSFEAEAIAEDGDEIIFHNLTPKDVSILFSRDDLFMRDKVKIKSGDAEALPVKVMMAAGEQKTYPYAVYCKCTDDFARAGSMPIIIIIRK